MPLLTKVSFFYLFSCHSLRVAPSSRFPSATRYWPPETLQTLVAASLRCVAQNSPHQQRLRGFVLLTTSRTALSILLRFAGDGPLTGYKMRAGNIGPCFILSLSLNTHSPKYLAFIKLNSYPLPQPHDRTKHNQWRSQVPQEDRPPSIT